MSRTLTQRWELTGTLIADSAVRVGDLGTGTTSELTQARDGLGRPVLPGTSLAGVIRAALPQRWARDDLWGSISGRNDNGGDDGTGRGSWVWVDDACAPANTMPENTMPEYRDSTAIDRYTGAAARGQLFTQEILPAGTEFTFRLAIDDPDSGTDTSAGALITEITALLRGGVAIGAATTRGLGRIHLREPALHRLDLATRAGLIDTLLDRPIKVNAPDATTTVPTGVLRVTIPWTPRGPLMVRVAADTASVSAHPLTALRDGNPRLLLPGSSIKGVLRSHSERILRTQDGDLDAPADFLDQMRAVGMEPVVALFGTGNDHPTPQGWRGAITVHECHGTCDLPGWDSVRLPKKPPANDGRPKPGPPKPGPPKPRPPGIGAPEDPDRAARRDFAGRLDKLNTELSQKDAGVRFVVANHVAVDRWTGGAAEGKLFAVLEPEFTGATPWEPITLDIDTTRLGDQAQATVRLLMFLLRDVCEGWLGIGYGTTRGMGAVSVHPGEVSFTAGPDVPPPWSAVHGHTLATLLADPAVLDSPTVEPDQLSPSGART